MLRQNVTVLSCSSATCATSHACDAPAETARVTLGQQARRSGCHGVDLQTRQLLLGELLGQKRTAGISSMKVADESMNTHPAFQKGKMCQGVADGTLDVERLVATGRATGVSRSVRGMCTRDRGNYIGRAGCN